MVHKPSTTSTQEMQIPYSSKTDHPLKLRPFQVDADTNNSVVKASLKPEVHLAVDVSDINIVLLFSQHTDKCFDYLVMFVRLSLHYI